MKKKKKKKDPVTPLLPQSEVSSPVFWIRSMTMVDGGVISPGELSERDGSGLETD